MSARLRRLEPLDALRLRMVRETEAALLLGLQHPELAPRIPTVEVGQGSFSPRFARDFWKRTLDLDDSAEGALDPQTGRM